MADQQQPGLLANILAVAGFFILIVIIVWGAYHLLRLTGTGLSSLFSRWGGNDSRIELSVPSSPVKSGVSFDLSWKHKTDEEGTYAFLYQCKPGFRFETSAGDARSAIPCGNAYTVDNTMTLSLIPTLSGTSSLEIPLSIVFMPRATSTEERPQGSAVVTVVPDTSAPAQPRPATPTTPTTPTTETPRPTTPSVPATPGIADLSVRILATGIIDAAGNFVARQPVSQDEIAAVKFDIANNGTASTGTWYFTVQIPVPGGYTYSSPAQMNLTPGSHIENILRFKPVLSGGGLIVVNVDPTSAVRESNESNNSASQYFSAPAWTTGYYFQPQVY